MWKKFYITTGGFVKNARSYLPVQCDSNSYYRTPKYQLFRSPYRRELTTNFLQKKGQILAFEGLKIELTLWEDISNMQWAQ